MKTQLKRLLALNLAIILLLCAVFPASAAGTAAQPAADAQPQQTAQPTEDSTQPQTTAPNPGTHTLTINGETRTIGTERQSGVGWTSVATMNGDGEPVYALTLNDYKGDPITITSNHDYTGSTRPIVMLRFIGQCNIRGRQDSAALSLSGYRGLVIMMDESTVAGSSALSIGGNPTISIPDGWVRLDSNEITLTSWNGDPAVNAQSVNCDLPTYKTKDNGNGGIWFISTAEPRTVTVKGNGGTNWNGTTDDVTLTCEENSQLDLANAFTQSKKYVAYYQGDDGQTYSPFLIYPDLKPGNTVLTAVWDKCDYEIPAIFYGNLGDDRNVTVVDGSREWTAPMFEPYDISQYHNTPLCWENQIGDRVTQLLSGQKMPALTRPTAYHAVYTVSETGLIFCANGETFDYGWVVLQPVYTYTANENWSRYESGKKFLSWNTKPDGTGKTYANGEDVPESHNQLVWLYAQWEQNGPQPGKHTLTIDGETHTIGTGTVTGDGWEAYAFLNGDNEPLLVLALNDYKGGPIRISDPTGVGTAKQVYALVSISGTNTVTAQSGAGITAEGYTALTIERYSRTASLTVSGQPAVQTGGRLQIFSGGITLDGGTTAAYAAANGFVYNDGRCEANETKTGDLVTKLVMRDVSHYLVVNGQRYYLSEQYPHVSGSGWGAVLTKNGDGLPTLCISLYGYAGGAISFSAPYNAGETADVIAILNYTGQNQITNESGAAIAAYGYSWLTLQEQANGSSLTVSGKPAVRTDKGLTLSGRNITLDGLNGPAYQAEWLGNDDSVCDMDSTWQDGTVVRVTTSEPTMLIITVYKDESKSEKRVLSARKNKLIDLTNLFTQTKQYITSYEDANGGRYQTILSASHDLELTAVWEPCDAEVPVVFYVMPSEKFAEAKVVDAARDGWTAPEQPDFTDAGGYTNTFLCWERKTGEDEYTYLLPGQPQKALTAGVGYYSQYTIYETGIVYYGNGEAFTDGRVVIYMGSPFHTMYWESKSRKVLTGWNTEPDGSGTSYAADGEEVPAAHTSLVRLYAQWADPENSVRVRFYAGAVGYDEEKWLPRGSQIQLPELGALYGQEQPYWDVDFIYADGRRIRENKHLSGQTITIPADAAECRLNAYWLPAEPLVIGGRSFSLSNRTSSFFGENWSVRYYPYEGLFIVQLYGYQGSAISLPAYTQLRVGFGENTITAAAGKPAIACIDGLELVTVCSDDSHASLRAFAGEGAPAVMAVRVINSRAPHMEFHAGAGKNVFADGTALELGTAACSYSGVLNGETAEITLDPSDMPAAISDLYIHPHMSTLTVKGGGATTTDGGTQVSKQVEAGQMTSYHTIGFTYPGYWCSGYHNVVGNVAGSTYEVSVPERDCTIELEWVPTGYASFLAFRVSGELKNETKLDPAHFFKTRRERVVFVDYQNGTAAVPELQFENYASYGDLLYWYTEDGKASETKDSQQFLPGESITEKENGIQSGTTLCAVADGEYRLVFYANGKLFDNGGKYGKKVIGSYGNYSERWDATDGSQLFSWNTQPDGTGTSYAFNRGIPGNVKKLYAQWLETGSVPVKLYNYVDYSQEISSAKIGSSYVLPEPSETPDGLRFTQWRCYYRDQNGRYQQIGMIAAGESLTVTEDMKEINAVALWLPDGKLTVDGIDYAVEAGHTSFEFDGWSAYFHVESGRLEMELRGYQGSDISLPCAANVRVIGGENWIDGTLSCVGELCLDESCAWGEHPSLTITAKEADKPAILTNKLTLERVPHMTLTAGANSKAIASLSGKEEFNIDTDTTHYYGRTSREASENSVGEGEIGDMWQLRTEPVMCTTTVDGNGGTTADGAASITLQLEYGEGYNLRSAGFKKQYADLIGAEGSTGNSYGTTIWSYPQLAFTLTWKDLGYPYIAFRGSGILKGEDVPADSYVAYYRNSDTLTAPKLVYQNAASYGDLVYWYTSENGTETADSRCYLPGETVQEPDDTTLFAASVNPGEVALVATGTTFKNWSRIKRAESCQQLVSEDGRVVESWNTKPDGSGTRYEIGTYAILIKDSPRVLYAQWKSAFTASASTDSATGETTLTIQSSSDLIEPPRNTDDKPFEQSVRVILAAYQNGRFVRMVYAEARDGVIRCKLPRGLDYRNCELRLFFLEGGKPSRAPENIQIEA